MCEDGRLDLSVIPIVQYSSIAKKVERRNKMALLRIGGEDCMFNCRIVLPNFGILCSRLCTTSAR